ncbi:exonuclease SbcCD subunit D [Aquibacillus sediminis]|uniref:exonuclease SbcCD subunit D n=1 Tax=Aquibacillus sediminis TaxID=2574734 RepID=UPI0011085EE7|nr:exonuclease SbcCD subunit D [Aquibacillus sediminis]
MKLFHTADWHLGKLVQGIYMTEDQRYILDQFVEAIKQEQPDAVIIAGDLYDRGVPPTDAVNLLDEVLETIVLDLKTPVIAVAGNHDSPGRLNFGTNMMKYNGYHMVGQFPEEFEPVILSDHHGEVHFHLVPYTDPSVVRHVLDDEEIQTHNDAMTKIVEKIKSQWDPSSRHVFVGHAFVTPNGESMDNTSDSERPLSIGGAEHVDANLFTKFNYTALGHLHQAHYVLNETIQYSGSPLKYSISEESHNKGFHIVDIDETGAVTIEKHPLVPKHDIRTVEATMNDLLTHPKHDDYVFVRLLDDVPILSPMEKVRSVYPNAMHVERKLSRSPIENGQAEDVTKRTKMDDFSLFEAFYKEVKGQEASEETKSIFKEVLQELLHDDHEQTVDKRKKSVSN